MSMAVIGCLKREGKALSTSGQGGPQSGRHGNQLARSPRLIDGGLCHWLDDDAEAPAWAQFDQESFNVRQPEVEKGETEIEEHGAFFSGPTTEEDLRQSHEIEATYGVTDRWQLIVEGLLEQPVHENLEGTEIEVGTQFEMIKRKGDGFDLAFRAEYEAELEHDEADEILFGPIMKYTLGRASTTFDAFFTGQVGSKADAASLGFQYNWQFKYELNPSLRSRRRGLWQHRGSRQSRFI